MKSLVRKYSFLFLFSGAIIALDQITKMWVRNNLEIGEVWMPWTWLEPYARFVHWYNTGVAFGMFQGLGDIFKILAIIVAIGIIYFYPRVPGGDWTLKIAMGMQLGGAVGNLIDRLTIGHVTDFISVGNFPVFNVADSSITLGVVVLVVGMWIQERHEKMQMPEPVEAENPQPVTTGEHEDIIE